MAWKELYNHRPTPELVEEMIEVRWRFIELAEYLVQVLPESRAKSLAKTHLEDALMRSTQALALQGEQLEKGK